MDVACCGINNGTVEAKHQRSARLALGQMVPQTWFDREIARAGAAHEMPRNTVIGVLVS